MIMERVIQLDTLANTCILEVLKARTWMKLLNPSGDVHSEIIREFFSNASVDGDHVNCWVRHKEFVITRESVQEFLESIEKRNSRTVLPFATLLLGLIAKAKFKLPSGLTVVQRDYPIGAHTVTRSTAHIRESKTSVS
ncbi:hypothetical protein SO802_017769 [Lithocarpus litseifolius]|uniref:Uncharacterized protein n=1 Tax=Lithocarpus litseifolius TaxID=425828 RepID=A0AAW2CJF6_9ROSI